jgi:anti-anti-sigma factor
LAAEGDTVTLDLTLVEYVNSISIGILVALCMDLREAGKRAILQPSKAIKRVLDLTGLTETFTRAAKAIEKPKERTRSKKAQF